MSRKICVWLVDLLALIHLVAAVEKGNVRHLRRFTKQKQEQI